MTRAWRVLCPVALLLCLVGMPVEANLRHLPPPASLQYHLEDGELLLLLTVQSPIYEAWFERVPSELPDLGEEEYLQELDHIGDFLRRESGLSADGIAITPRVNAVEFLEQFEENDFQDCVTIEVAYGLKAVPRSMTLEWREFDSDQDGWPLDAVEATVEFATDLQVLTFYPDGGTSATWIRPDFPAIPDPARLVVKTIAPHEVPVLAGGALIGAALLGGLGLCRSSLRRRAWIPAGLLTLAAIPLGFAPPVIPVRLPGEARFELPDADDARYVFESLLRNVYRAFDYDTESDIYDALARSVEAGLLEQVYGEVYRGLVMKDEGGAVARVRGVELLETRPVLPDHPAEPIFQVECRWRVTGSVAHWGHSHRRVNEYSARFEVRGTEDRWRLSSVEVTDLGRVDDPEAR